jgi:hypothetical protein
MYAQKEKPKENKSRAVANSVSQKKSNAKQGFGFVDNREETHQLYKLQELANSGQRENLSKQYKAITDNHVSQRQQSFQKKQKNTEETMQCFPAPHAVPVRIWLTNLRTSLAEHGLSLSGDERFVFINGQGDINSRHIHIDFVDDGTVVGGVVRHMVLSLILPKGNFGDEQARPHLENVDSDNWTGAVGTFPEATRNVVSAFRAWYLGNRYVIGQ